MFQLKNVNDDVIMYREADVIAFKDLKASEPIELDNFDEIHDHSSHLNDLTKSSKLLTFLYPHQKTKQKFTKKRLKRSVKPKIFKRDQRIHYPGPVACHVELISDHTYAARYNYDSKLIANEMHLQLMKVNEIYQNTGIRCSIYTLYLLNLAN